MPFSLSGMSSSFYLPSKLLFMLQNPIQLSFPPMGFPLSQLNRERTASFSPTLYMFSFHITHAVFIVTVSTGSLHLALCPLRMGVTAGAYSALPPTARLGPRCKEWYCWSWVVSWLEPHPGERASVYLSFASHILCLCKLLSFWVENLSFFLQNGKSKKPVPSPSQKPTKNMNLRVDWWMCQNPLVLWKIPLESEDVGIAIIIWFPNGKNASRNVLCLMNQCIFSPHWWIWESNTCHLEIIDTSWWSAYVPLMKFWILIKSEEKDMLHGSNIVL